MLSLILRGVLLPLIFFITFQADAKSSTGDLYNVFYLDLKSYDEWVKSDRNNTFKDIFIKLYNLPAKNRRKFSNSLNLKVIDSFSDDKVNTAYTYLEFKSRTSVDFVIWGIKSGSVKINGSKKGDIDIKNDTGFALLKGTFEKGVYFVSVKIVERFKGVPIIVLSNKKVETAQRGFNRKADCSAKTFNVKAGYPEVDVSGLYSGFCFPYADAKDKRIFYNLTLRTHDIEKTDSSLLYGLFQLKNSEHSIQELKKQGFTEKQLDWWKERIYKEEVCSYE